MDTWNIEKDVYDYSLNNKQEPTASYLSMLLDCEIEPTYNGFCTCSDWNKFLYFTLHCLLNHVAPYGIVFYVPAKQFMFYFHHTGSIGLYYKELTDKIVAIIKSAESNNMEIKYSNDKRIKTIISKINNK